MMKAVYLDIILPNDEFLCQLAYIGTPKKMLKTDKCVVQAYDPEVLKNYVLQKRPTLKHKNFTIELTYNRL